MPVVCSFDFTPIDEQDFKAIDNAFIGLSYNIHNEIGRLLEEIIYKREIERRCRLAGIKAEREGRILVSHGSFSKYYLVDLVIAQGIIYEIKTVERLCQRHLSQTLNYLFLCGGRHGKVINFQSIRVEWLNASAIPTSEERHKFTIHTDGWHEINKESCELKSIMWELLEDWGAFLECQLYEAAINHLKSKSQELNPRLPLHFQGHYLGEHEFNLLSQDTAFYVTAIKDISGQAEKHIASLLSLTNLRAMQWINLWNHDIYMKTIFNHS